jgi:hypothetical protein
MVAARVLSYGKDYEVDYAGETVVIDLSELKHKPLDKKLYKPGQNNFTFSLPNTGNVVTFKLLTHADDKAIDQEVKGLQKINKDNLTEVTTRLKRIITSVNGNSDIKDIRDFVDNYLLAKDARALREEYSKLNPDIDLTFTYMNSAGEEEVVAIPIGVTFFWPDAKA